jgi:hypothetical protein
MAQAYYNFEAKIIQRSKGQSSVAAAAYNAGEKLKDERTGIIYDYKRKQDVYHAEILTPDVAPEWASDRQELWNRAEREEKRKDSQVGRQFIMCFPTCLTHEEKIALSKQFLREEFVSQGYAVDVAYHDFQGKNAHNPHAHVLVSSRAITSMGFCSFKDRSWNRKDKLFELREKWAAIQNRHFEQTGREERVDHRSYQEQGITRVPEKHEGKAVSAIRRKIEDGRRQDSTSLIDLNNEIRRLNKQLEIERTTLAELKAKAAKEQDNQQSEQTTNNVLAIAQPTIEELKTEAKALHQQQREQFTLDIAEIVQATQAPSPNKAEIQGVRDRVQPITETINQPQQSPKRGTMPPPPREPEDRTYKAVWRQLHAFDGNGMVEIGILDPETGKMKNQTYHRDALLRVDPDTQKAPVLTYLKAQNAKGCHLYVRPAAHENGDTQGFVLIDDIDEITVSELRDMHPQGQRGWNAPVRNWRKRRNRKKLPEQPKGAQAYHPYTDAEIGIKLRMAGFGKQRIYDCIRENSPFAAHLNDEDAKTRYLYKGIAPLMDNPKINQKIAQWNQFRTREAIAMPEDKRDAYIKEHRLEELKLSITKERWAEQLQQSHSHSERER